VVEVRPLAEPARMRRRHWGLLASFVALVLVPLAAIVFYLWAVAEDQYSSTTGFTVRQEEGTGASDFLGGLAQFTGANTGSDSDILYEFIQSQEIVAAVDAALDLRSHYVQPWPRDFVFALWPEATIEDLLWYWQRMVRISYDQSTGLIEVRALAFDPDMARAVSAAIVAESQDMINDLNTQAREDAMRYAREDLAESVARLKVAREALTQFRTRTQIVDPAADIAGRMGVMNNLQQQLAEALIEYDLVRETTSDTDPRVLQAQRRIEVIRDRIRRERQGFASGDADTGGIGEDYPVLIAEFESLSVDREFAEEAYRAALAALDLARANAARQSRYLAAYIAPTRAQTSEFPQRGVLAGLALLFLLMAWSIGALIYYSIRDRS
jgi:capsular polysaccharide transport system permease protein